MVVLTTLAITSLLGLASAQFPPKLEGVTVIQSKLHESVSISYKEVLFPPILKFHGS